MFSLMGNCCAACLRGKQPARNVTLAIVGLDNAGKTVTTKGLQGEPLDSVAPTIGFSSADFRFEKFQVTLYDLGGGKRIRNIWQQYLFEIYGLVYVVDSSEVERMDECREVLADLLEHPKVAGKPILLLANKQDKSGALDEIDICESLCLEELVNMNKCPCRVEMCAAIIGKGKKLDRAISAGMSWLLETISANYEKLDERVQKDKKENEDKLAQEKKERAERVRRQREERDREKEAARARGEIPDSEEEDEPDFNIADPFKKLDYNELVKKDQMLKNKKKKKKERESARILSDDSDDSSRRARRHSNEDLRHSYDNGHVRTGKARTPRDMRTRSRSPSPNGRIRARSLSPPLRKSIFDPYHTNSKEKLVGRRDSAEDENSSRQLPWLKQKGARSNSPPDRFRSQDDDIQVPPRGRGLSPLAPLDSVDRKKKKKKKSKRNQIVPDGEEEDHDDTPRGMDVGGYNRMAPRGWNTPPLARSAHKASRSPRLEPLAEPEHEMDSFASKWGLVDELPEVHDPMPRRNRPNSEYDDDLIT